MTRSYWVVNYNLIKGESLKEPQNFEILKGTYMCHVGMIDFIDDQVQIYYITSTAVTWIVVFVSASAIPGHSAIIIIRMCLYLIVSQDTLSVSRQYLFNIPSMPLLGYKPL